MSVAKNSNDFSGAISIIGILIPGNSTSEFGDFIEQRNIELMSQQKRSPSKTRCSLGKIRKRMNVFNAVSALQDYSKGCHLSTF